MKTAVIVGCNGQDGKLLYDLLSKRNYAVVGIGRDSIRSTGSFQAGSIDIANTQAVFDLIKSLKPDEIYYLAAFHQSSEELPSLENIGLVRQSYNVNVLWLANFLEGIRRFSPKTRLFYAASCRVFGLAAEIPQDESTPMNPNCVYGITKAAGLMTCRFYRNNYSLFASVGILYNHESALRSARFVSKKIVTGAIDIKRKKKDKLVLGDLKAEVDWGYAADYVEAMRRILNYESADDFVIATGQKHSVLDFVKLAFGYLRLDWELYVESNPGPVSRQVPVLVGNPAKLMRLTGWKPTVEFEEMVKLLLIEEGVVFDNEGQNSGLRTDLQ